jgi:NADH-quinone oxidoreductase subunit L
VGALTALMAATIAITQNDIKKVLAYSTVSQLGFMFMATGVGAFFVAIFHVMTHAFFKGCLFLGSGSVIHAMHHVEHELHHEGKGHLDPQDMRTMGGLKRYMPSTRLTFLFATVAIAGFPLTAGFFSKDEILFKAFEAGSGGHDYAWLVWGVGILTALLTAIYMGRCYMLTFEGEPRWPAADRVHPHESPLSMTIPLWVLGLLSLGAGFLGLPAVLGDVSWIHHWLAGGEGPVAEAAVEAHVSHALEWGLLALGAVIALVGLGLAWRWYGAHGPAFDARVRARWGPLYKLWEGKYFVDELYQETVVDPLLGTAERGLAPFDARVVDGLVNGVAKVTRGVSSLMRYMQTGIVQSYAIYIVLGVVLVVGLMLFG